MRNVLFFIVALAAFAVASVLLVEVGIDVVAHGAVQAAVDHREAMPWFATSVIFGMLGASQVSKFAHRASGRK